MTVNIKILATFALLVVLIGAVLIGCRAEQEPQVELLDFEAAKYALNNSEAQTQAVNDAILANHPHFTKGEPLEISLTATALDFMIGRSVQDFPDLFSTVDKPMVAGVATYYPHDAMEDWVKKVRKELGSETQFYLLNTRIGLTYGFEGQADYLLIAVLEEKIVEYRLFSITLY